MFHRNRVWCVTPVGSAEELARKLTTTSWTCCTAFELGGYLWLNDATSPDGAQGFSAVKKAGPNGRPWQVESITVSWCDYAELLAYVLQTLRGESDQSDFAHEVAPALQTPAEHGRCCHCA